MKLSLDNEDLSYNDYPFPFPLSKEFTLTKGYHEILLEGKPLIQFNVDIFDGPSEILNNTLDSIPEGLYCWEYQQYSSNPYYQRKSRWMSTPFYISVSQSDNSLIVGFKHY